MAASTTTNSRPTLTSASRAQVVTQEYSGLRRLAAQRMANERPNHMLTGTALANEVAMKFLTDQRLPTADRAQFFAYATAAMRHHLVDHARARTRLKRGGDRKAQPYSEDISAPEEKSQDVDVLTESLQVLERLDPRRARVVRLRFFEGMSNPAVAAALGVSVATVKRDWEGARAWLETRMRDTSVPTP